ncbi:MAG TPA: TlpA disulfide reductase family protein [Gemmatimonadaceae bacterium]|nr:TlpA disulfide reductase family protein [Gemmatimonadaceae bacterium]
MIARSIGRLARVFPLATLAAIALALPACARSADRDTPAQVAVGAPVPEYEAVTLAGDSVSLAGQHGKVVLLNIWATWCHPCRQEIPVLQRLHEANAARGLEVVGVSVDAAGDERKIRDFAREFAFTYPIWLDPAERVSTIFLAPGVPASYLIGRDGTLRWRHVGPVREGDPGLAAALEKALGE